MRGGQLGKISMKAGGGRKRGRAQNGGKKG